MKAKVQIDEKIKKMAINNVIAEKEMSDLKRQLSQVKSLYANREKTLKYCQSVLGSLQGQVDQLRNREGLGPNNSNQSAIL